MSSDHAAEPLAVEAAVMNRYSAGAQTQVPELCCPIHYDPQYLEAIPQDIIDRDYGCGDPSAFVAPGDTVLDLGSGAGKICFIASQIVGPTGRVIGVDLNRDMLALARHHRPSVAGKTGFDNVRFVRGRIQDLALDLDALDRYIADHAPRSVDDWLAIEEEADRLRRVTPLIADGSIDIVLSNCVLNLVRSDQKQQMFAELRRVLRPGGRAAISDIVSDEPIPQALQDDPELWSGCISGAFEEQAFLTAFEDAGFHGIELVKRDARPWRVVAGIEFRSVTVLASAPPVGACLEQHHALIYRGPFSEVRDDDGHVFRRGAWTAVCGKTFAEFSQAPYHDAFHHVEPRTPVAEGEAAPFDCARTAPRHPREIKGADPGQTPPEAGCCGSSCC